MSPVHDEHTFGVEIVAAMVENGWRQGNPHEYRPDLGLDMGELLAFIESTQHDEWEDLLGAYGGDSDEAQRGFARAVDREIGSNGLVEVLRSGVRDRGVRIRVAYFKPNLVTSEDALAEYKANRLTVVRELPYATKQADAGHRLDLALLLNGIPIATAELKNPLTGQNVEHAKNQYRTERDATELIFTRRVIANFAVDPDLVFVTTQLRGAKTRFLPFNTGSEGAGKPGGAGNPMPIEPGKYPTSYLWEQVWHPDNWLDMLERFVHIHESKGAGGRGAKTIIFPRFHQWDAVKKLTAHAAIHGAGHDYLVMHSAGSGKSNTIGWLAHRLSDLHTPTDPSKLDPDARAAGLKPGTPVFDKTIIITDRRNLDSQLSETVGGFERVAGLVVKIDDKQGAKSEKLAKALSQEEGKIITVTLHTFPALLDYLRRSPTELLGGRFAIIVDEAHSSQSGDAAKAVRSALRDLGLDPEDEEDGAAELTLDERLKQKAAERGKARNISYFAFTATPKSKTLENFGTLVGQKYEPFHTYSMRQAIDEGFILDPLRNYVTYKTFYRLVNDNPSDYEVPERKANALLARFAVMHPHTVDQHAQVIVEHFVAHTRPRLGGRAKSMVVTASRHSAVAMSRAIKRYIEEREYDKLYPDIGVLVAFSGALDYEGEETTEPKENDGLPESQLPKAFGYTRADDVATRAGGKGQKEYRILVVAEKYQTGFDQPLLTTMYVNKTLAGIAAVQTLSRLNRTHERKSQQDLVVLDFVNDAEKIRDAFRPYYEEAHTLPTDPNLLYLAQDRVMSAQLLSTKEMREFANAYLLAEDQAAGSQAKWQKLHAELYRLLAPAVERFTELLDNDEEDDVEKAENFRADLNDYVRKYGFLAQIVPYQDSSLELLHLYGRHLLNRLPRRSDGGVDIGDVDLSHMRLVKTGEHDIGLNPEGPSELRGFGDGTGAAQEPEKSPLSELIDEFNKRHGTSFTEEDAAKPFNEAAAEPHVQLAAVANHSEEEFGRVFDPVFEEKMMDHYETISNLGKRYFSKSDPAFKETLNRQARSAAWRMIRRQQGVA
ncbi:type I restriction endonuclease subunit R [Nocardia veterana]|uniref:Type I restriction endonuclease subunit R n=1 Tax=Nocardia veterana TaxID=132249 RepID=A0A7X6RJZ8_9NOCA|nr:type I restriction endonuclease [Nocardia veterana]NKY88208.1 type I restriction endonuclease subunit R [Nocardia veterana]